MEDVCTQGTYTMPTSTNHVANSRPQVATRQSVVRWEGSKGMQRDGMRQRMVDVVAMQQVILTLMCDVKRARK